MARIEEEIDWEGREMRREEERGLGREEGRMGEGEEKDRLGRE